MVWEQLLPGGGGNWRVDQALEATFLLRSDPYRDGESGPTKGLADYPCAYIIYNGLYDNMIILERLIGFIAPHPCLNCVREGSLLCAVCLPQAVPPLPPRCYRCYAATTDYAVCQKCRRSSQLKHVWVAGEYGGLAKQLVRRLKFERTKAGAGTVAAILADKLPCFESSTLVTHLPAATSRVRARGYDQSRLIAVQLAGRLGYTHLTLLARHGQSRQVGAKRDKRLRQLEGAYSPLRPYAIKGAHIVLVDDVTTTGASLEEAAKVLKAAGAKTVDAAVFAQKPLV